MRKLLGLLAVLWALPVLAQFPISQLPPANLPLTGTELFPCTQAGSTKRCLTGSVTASTGGAFILQSPNAGLALSRTLVGTANEILLADGGPLGNLVLSTPQAIASTSSPTFSSLTLTNKLTVPNGGTGATTLTGLVLGNGALAMTAYAGTSCTNQFTRALNANGVATCNTVANTDLTNSSITLNGAAIALGGTRTLSLASADFANQGTTTTVLHGNAAGNPSFGSVVSADLAAGVFANPTALVGLTAVNGVATTAKRSDSSSALDQTIAPTMTGLWNFSPSPTGTTPAVHITNAGTSIHTLIIDTPALSSGIMVESPNVTNTGGSVIVLRDTTNSLDRGFFGFGGGLCIGGAVTDNCITSGIGGKLHIYSDSGATDFGVATGELSTSITLQFTTTGANCSINGTNGTLLLRKIGNTVTAHAITTSGTCTTAAVGALSFVAGTIPAAYSPVHQSCVTAVLSITAAQAGGEVCVTPTGGLSLVSLTGNGTSFGLPQNVTFTYSLD